MATLAAVSDWKHMAVTRSISRRGALFGLLAAALFGLSTPISKRLLVDMPPQLLAGLLYIGAGLGLTLYRGVRPSTREAPLRRADTSRMFWVVLLGGALGPVLMLLGLRRVTAVVGSLLLNLEAVFTILVAVTLFREHLGRRAGLASILVVAGAAVLGFGPGDVGADWLGSLCIAGACACWAVDNNLTQQLTSRDPVAIVQLKALAAGILNASLGLVLGAGLPPTGMLLAALGLGCLSFGASIVLDAYALRCIGAAREAAYFATSPFFGALAATLVLGERLRGIDVLAMLVMCLGMWFLLRERHGHEHVHEVMEHEHVHVHDEHHRHEHTPNDPPGEPHAHSHRHAALVHDHPHVPDQHHRHRH